MRRIVITAKTDGTTSVEAEGFLDGSCKNYTQPLATALGAQSKSGAKVEDKPEASIPSAATTLTIHQA